MPKYLWRPYTRAIKSLGQYEENELRLIKLSGYDIDKLIELFAAGWTLEPPSLTTTSFAELAEGYCMEPTFKIDENGQLGITEVSIVEKG